MKSDTIDQLLEKIKTELLDRVKSKEWMDINEASTYLGISINTTYKYVSNNKIPFRKIPGSNKLRFRKKHLDYWIESEGNIKK